MNLREFDKDVAEAIDHELERQRTHIELIASENFVSRAVLEAQGSILTNKYAEGYSGKRYYGGCEHIDVIETLAIERAKELFHAGFANVQPHSGASANLAAYNAILMPGDTILGMSLDAGGHLTHGYSVNFSGKIYKAVNYGLTSDGYIDYDKVEEIALDVLPNVIVAGASAYSRIIDFKRFREIVDKVTLKAGRKCFFMVDMAHIAGLVAAGYHMSPIPYADVTTTTTHKTLRGPRGGMILCSEEVNAKYNFNKAIFPGIQGGPLMHVIAGKAVCFKEALSQDYKDYMGRVVENAATLAAALQDRGFDIVSGGTDNHLMLVDLKRLGLTGKEVEKALDEVRITVNKNTVPNDPQSPFVTSGIRVGTPAVTTRGAVKEDMFTIADAFKAAILDKDSAAAEALVKSITDKYPLYK